MEGLVDIHNHILFKCDDGADSLGMSLDMIVEEYKQGVRQIILTPHYDEESCKPSVERITKHFAKLEERVKELYPDMKLYLGNEILLCNDMVEKLDEGRIFTLANTKYILLEFYPLEDYMTIEKSVSILLNGGYIPVIAHCERYKALRKRFGKINIDNIKHLVDMGCYLQVNVTSVFDTEKKFVKELIKENMLHLVATDAHSLGRRGIYWDKCISYLESKYDKEYLEWLLKRNPQKVISGEYI